METIKTFYCLLPARTRSYVVTGSSACLGHFAEVPSQLGTLTESADPKSGSSAVCPPCVRRRGAQCVHYYFHLPAPPLAFFYLVSLVAHVVPYKCTSMDLHSSTHQYQTLRAIICCRITLMFFIFPQTYSACFSRIWVTRFIPVQTQI